MVTRSVLEKKKRGGHNETCDCVRANKDEGCVKGLQVPGIK